MKRERYQHLLEEDLDLKRWYKNVARGSEVTADVYLRRLGAFCESNSLTPKGLLSTNAKEIHNKLMDYVTMQEDKNYAGSYIQSSVKAVKSWLAHNNKELKGKIRIKGAQDTPSLKDERVPTHEELKTIFLSADKKARVACALIAHAGLRLEVVGNYKGNDGLKVGDLPELVIENGIVKFSKSPTMVRVRSELSKARNEYFTFLSEEACEYVRDYLEERLRGGERLTTESPIVTPKISKKAFIRSINVGDAIRGAIRRAGFPWRPYVLRSYFDTQLMLAEAKGLIIRDYRTFFMGHKGDIENRYTTNRHKLPEEVIEGMREAYRRSQEFLQTTTKSEGSEEKMKQEFKRQLLLVAGFGQDEISQFDLSSISDEEFQSKVRQKLLGVMANNGSKQRLVSAGELDSFMAQGWEFVATLPDERVIMKLPF